MIGYEGIDVKGVRLHPAVIANYTKLSHHYQKVRDEARTFLINGAVVAAKNYEAYIEPGLFFTQATEDINQSIAAVLEISGCADDWSDKFTPNDLVLIFLGTEDEPSVIDKLNYPVKAQQTKQALEHGVPFEMQALVTCMFLTEHGEFDTAKQMIDELTPEQLEVIVTTKTLLLKRSAGDKVKTTKQLAELAGVSVDTAEKVLQLVGE